MPSEQDNEAKVRQYLDEFWNKRNFSIAEEFFAPDSVSHTPYGEKRGPQDHKQAAEKLLRAAPDFNTTIETIIAKDDMVIVRGRDRFTHKGEYMGYPATGNEVTVTWMTMYRMENGRVVEEWVEQDMKHMLEQMGAQIEKRAA